jgi:hypothetical protein
LEDSPENRQEGPESTPEPAGQPRPVNAIVVAGGVILIGLVAFALYQRGRTTAPVPEPAAASSTPAPGDEPLQGTAITATVPVRLSPEAAVVAERYRCICSCNDPLNVCTCTKTPGSRDMRQYVQELVNQKKSGEEIDQAMIAKYGPQVVITAAAPSPTPAKTRKRR